MSVVRGAAARRLALRTHAQHLQPGRATPAESRPGHRGAVSWTLACSARQLSRAAGLPLLQREELSELLLPLHGGPDTARVLDSVSRVIASLGASGSGARLRLSASAAHLLIELTGPDSSSSATASDRTDAALLSGARSAGRHQTFGEGRSRHVTWAEISLPAPRLVAPGAAAPAPEPDDDWA